MLCILFRSSINLIIRLPRLLDICSCFHFVCISVSEENCLIFFFTFFFFCYQSIFCNIILISCLVLTVDSVSLPCVSPSLYVTVSLCDTLFCVCVSLPTDGVIVSDECLRIARISLNFSIFIFTDFKSCSDSSTVEAMQQSSYVNSSPVSFGIFFSRLELRHSSNVLLSPLLVK